MEERKQRIGKRLNIDAKGGGKKGKIVENAYQATHELVGGSPSMEANDRVGEQRKNVGGRIRRKRGGRQRGKNLREWARKPGGN